MFRKQNEDDITDAFADEVREFVWQGNRKVIRERFLHRGALAMVASLKPQRTRARMRQALREALLEPNRRAKRHQFTDGEGDY